MKGLPQLLRRLLAFTLAVVLLGAFVPDALAQGGRIADAQVVTNTLNMRANPSQSAPIVQVLTYGTLLTVQGRNPDGSWLFVHTDAAVTGWVATNWVALRAGLDVNALPVSHSSGTPASPQVLSGLSAGESSGGGGGNAPLPQSGLTATVVTRVNIRSGPGTQYRRLGTLGVGTQMALGGRDISGLWVYGTTNTGITGWVAARFLNTNLAQISALPTLDNSAPVSVASAAPPIQPPAAAQPAPAAQSAPAQPAVPAPGLATAGGFALGGQINSYSQENWMRTAGMTWVKRQVLYARGVDPNGQAGAINEAHAHGFRILLSVTGHPEEIAADPNYAQNYASFVGRLAALGADGIEVRNEMNIDREWPTGRIDPAWYTQILAAAYSAIKANNPGTLVISGAPSPTGAEGAFGLARVWNDDRYIYGMAAAGAAQYADCIGIHYNEGIIPPSQRSGDPRGGHYTRYFWGMVDLYWNAFGGQRQLCFTELGYLSAEGYGPLPGGFAWAANTTVAQQAAWLAEAVSLARSSGKVRMVIVWNVDFTGRWGDDPMGGYAIVRPDGSCPACQALANLR